MVRASVKYVEVQEFLRVGVVDLFVNMVVAAVEDVHFVQAKVVTMK